MKILKKGMVDEQVKVLKTYLNSKIQSTLDVENPFFGESTEQVVKQFQKANNLISDGIVGQLTWEFLNTPSTFSSSLSMLAIEIAKTQLNVREKTGKNDGEAVESYLRSVNLEKGYAWCQAFVYWCYNQASKSLKIENPLVKTAGVLHHWNTVDTKYKFSSPEAGDIFIMDFGKGNGHTGMVIKKEGTRIFTIEGNTGADPSTASSDREGDGVYLRNRLIKSIKGFIRYA